MGCISSLPACLDINPAISYTEKARERGRTDRVIYGSIHRHSVFQMRHGVDEKRFTIFSVKFEMLPGEASCPGARGRHSLSTNLGQHLLAPRSFGGSHLTEQGNDTVNASNMSPMQGLQPGEGTAGVQTLPQALSLLTQKQKPTQRHSLLQMRGEGT